MKRSRAFLQKDLNLRHYFSFRVSVEHLLLQRVNVTSTPGIIAASSAFFFGTFLLEGTKILMFYWTVRLQQNPLTYGQTNGKNQDLSPLFASLMIPSSLEQVRQRRLKFHFCGMLTHLFNVFLGYIIMLAVMQYNWWIFIAILLGSGFGYFFFGAIGYFIKEKYAYLSVKDIESSHINSTYEEEPQAA
ncbi:uncharacterized protein LOC133192080 isoform X2 [Saccostrea echinata]|uniref:uncharacterized protein LOC133192080 isoform X2 n=1 Tax=Saccostrea echinata TaxID=191078 RepID=UPI002A80B251|nr:uncharacterized protein LOC133192080 isoform X2 [Saccostrea echinata]